MKKIITTILISGMLLSCKKNNDTPIPSYVGVYTSASKDTVRVTQNGNYTKFVFRNLETVHTPVPPPTMPTNTGDVEAQSTETFDSVRVAPDLTFTDNEVYDVYIYQTGSIFPLPPPESSTDHNSGIGSFGINTISIKFDVLIFNGIKL